MVAMVRGGGRSAPIAKIAFEVAGAVGKIVPHDQSQVLVAAIPVLAGDRSETSIGEQRIYPTLMIAVIVDTGVGVKPHALEVIVHDEVHDTGNGVRAVGRGRATRQ